MTLAVTVGLVLAAAPGLLRLELATDGRELLPNGDPEVRYDRTLCTELGLRDPVAVVLWASHPEGIFEPRALEALRDLTDRLATLEGIGRHRVTSLATEPGTRTFPGTLRHRVLLDPLPRTPDDVARLREDLQRLPIYDGALVSRNGRGAAVIVELPVEADRRRLVAAIRERVTAPAFAGYTVDVVGAPVAEALLGDHLLADLGVPPQWLASGAAPRETSGLPVPLLPAALGLMTCVFLGAFRRPVAALLPLGEVAVCLILVFGLMGWVGVPIYLTTAILPVVLTAVGTADEIHVFRRLRETAQQPSAASWREVVAATMEDMAGPVTLTSVTTAIAFLSFALSPIGPMRVFGLAAAGGVLVCLSFTLTVLPALLVWLPPSSLLPLSARVARAPSKPVGRIRQPWHMLAHLVLRRPRTVLGGAAGALVLFAAFGLPGVRVEDSWTGGFAPHSPMAGAIARFEEGFLGSHLLRVVVEGARGETTGEVPGAAVGAHHLTLPRSTWPGSPDLLGGAALRVWGPHGRAWSTWIDSAQLRRDRLWLELPPRGGSLRHALRPEPADAVRFEIVSEPFRRPQPVATVAALEDFLSRQPGVGGVRGPAAYLRTAHDLATGEGLWLPDRPDLLRNAWQNVAALRGEARLRETVDPEGWDRALVTVFQRDSSYRASGRLLDALADWVAQHLAPRGLTVRTAGDVAVSRALIGAVVQTQLRSLALSLAGIALLVALLGGSWRWGIGALMPPALAIAVAFSALGTFGFPLGVATSMFAAIVLGVGVDGAVHLLTRLRRARAAGRGVGESLEEALGGVGPAIALDAAAVGGGFGFLMLSQVPANAHLGALLALAMASCLVANLLLLPALWSLRRAGRRAHEPPPDPGLRGLLYLTGRAGALPLQAKGELEGDCDLRTRSARRPGSAGDPPDRSGRCRRS